MGAVEMTGADMRNTHANAAAVIVGRFDRQPCQRRIVQIDRASHHWPTPPRATARLVTGLATPLDGTTTAGSKPSGLYWSRPVDALRERGSSSRHGRQQQD